MTSENKKKLINNTATQTSLKRSDLDKLISLMEASTLCNYSQEYLSLMARKGKIGAVKKGRNWVISRRVLLAYVEEHKADVGGNNRGQFSEDAAQVVKIYKQEKILSAFSVAKIKKIVTQPKKINKSFVASGVLALTVTMMFVFSNGLVLVKDLFGATVVRGAELSHQSLTEAKNIAIQMRRYISGESRQEVSVAKNIFFSGLGVEFSKANNFIGTYVVEPQFMKLAATTKYLPFNGQSFNLLSWNLNSFPETFVAMEKTILLPSSNAKKELTQAFGNFSGNVKYALNIRTGADVDEESVTPRVAGVQEKVDSPTKFSVGEEGKLKTTAPKGFVAVILEIGKNFINDIIGNDN